MSERQLTSRDNFARIFRTDMYRLQGDIEKAVIRATVAWVEVLKPQLPKDMGDLRRETRAEFNGKGAVDVVEDTPYAAGIEYGMRPHMPPVEPLIAWAERHGMEDPYGAGWAIARRIEREGLPAHFFTRDALPVLVEMIDAAVKAVG